MTTLGMEDITGLRYGDILRDTAGSDLIIMVIGLTNDSTYPFTAVALSPYEDIDDYRGDEWELVE